MSALWSRDPYTLWYGVERTLAPVIKANKFKASYNLSMPSFMTLIPFLVLPYTIWLANINKEQRFYLMIRVFHIASSYFTLTHQFESE
jgi:hypothetical protein